MCRCSVKVLVLLATLLGPLAVWGAASDIQVLALFRDHAVLMIDGVRTTLAAGERTPSGVKLLSADSNAAILEVNGRKVRAGLGTDVRPPPAHSTDMPEVRVYRGPSGMFTTVGGINGLPVSFLVDTGASQVAMNAAEAGHLGIDFRVVGTPVRVTTASGIASAFRITLKTVTVGAITLHNVPAVVIDGTQPPSVLLGMSFLGQLEMHNQGQCLVLRQRY
ncbi:MAG: TIGR02281 family clan AA aspartic protease [Gammaproteobacteria bacterium]